MAAVSPDGPEPITTTCMLSRPLKYYIKRKKTMKAFYRTIANKFPEPLLTNLDRVCWSLYLAPSGMSDNLA